MVIRFVRFGFRPRTVLNIVRPDRRYFSELGGARIYFYVGLRWSHEQFILENLFIFRKTWNIAVLVICYNCLCMSLVIDVQMDCEIICRFKMRPIPKKMREILADDPLFKICIHRGDPGHVCDSGITWEHSIIYGRKQINELWAIVPCCRSMNNDVSGNDKAFNRFLALYRLHRWDTDYKQEQMLKYSKLNLQQIYKFLSNKFFITDKVLGMKLTEEDVYLNRLGIFE